GYFFIPSTGSLLPLGRGRLQERDMVAIRVREVRGDAVVRLDRGGILELHSAGFQNLEILAAVVRLEHPVVAAAAGLGRRARIQLVPALKQDQLDVLSLRTDGEPSGVSRELVVRALFQSKHVRVELKGFLLAAHDDGRMRQFLDHGLGSTITYRLFNDSLMLEIARWRRPDKDETRGLVGPFCTRPEHFRPDLHLE